LTLDAYTFHEMQKAGAFDARPEDAPQDLLELLLDQFVATPLGRQVAQSPPQRDTLIRFLEHSRAYLQGNPVISQGMVEGGLTLVLQDGVNVPLVRPAEAAPARPSPVYAVTKPKEMRMKGMQGGEDHSIGVTGRPRG
jgi:hypothetical protein